MIRIIIQGIIQSPRLMWRFYFQPSKAYDFLIESNENVFPFEHGKTYCLATPYNTFGAAEILMNALKSSDTDK